MSWIQNTDWTVSRLINSRSQINLRPEYQRQFVWDIGMMQTLIWCMLRGQDIPKFYFHIRQFKPFEKWDVVDGQQRLETIYRFILEESFALSKNPNHSSSKPINGYEVAGKTFSELPDHLQEQLYTYEIVIAQMTTDDKSLVIDQFLSLQSGKILNGQERRQSRSGCVQKLVKDLGETEFVDRARLKRKRAGQYEAIARILCWEIADTIVDTSSEVLDRLYLEHAEDNDESWKTLKLHVLRILDDLNKAFPEYRPRALEIVNFMLLYWLMRHLRKNYVIDDSIMSKMPAWFNTFSQKQKRRKRKWSSSTNSAPKNVLRFSIMLKDFVNSFPELVQKDKQRSFRQQQRRKIWENADGRCQFISPDGKQCEHVLNYSDFDADHILPHAQGGPTSLENGRVLCAYRNRGGQGICQYQQAQSH